MPRTIALSLSTSLVALCVLFGGFYHVHAAGQNAYSTIDGNHLWQYVREQADIAERYRDQGHPQFWGRIAGTSGDVDDVQWLLAKYRQAGLTDIHSQTVNFFDPQWVPESWEVSATSGGKTVKLGSAQAPYGAVATDGKVLDLPVVYVGLGSDADFAGRDVRGAAVLFMRTQFTYNMPPDVLKRAEDRGAAAILASDLRGGNFNAQAYRAPTKLPSFNLGTDDAVAVRDLIAKAAAGDPPHVRIRLDAKWASGQRSFMVWGTLPGATDETIYVIAHRDGWFDAAGDNASGVATLLGVAEYFAKVPQNQRRRTLIFVGTDGHHQVSPGGYGREWLMANRDRLLSKTALVINAEHPAEVLTWGGPNGRTDAIIPNAWYAGGSARPQLTAIARDAFHEFGLPIWTRPSDAPPSGDIGPFVGLLPGVVAQSNDFLHMHTTGDTPDNVSAAGLAAAARAYAKIVDEVNKIPLSDLRRPAEVPYQPRINLGGCEAWIKDSSAACRPRTQR